MPLAINISPNHALITLTTVLVLSHMTKVNQSNVCFENHCSTVDEYYVTYYNSQVLIALLQVGILLPEVPTSKPAPFMNVKLVCTS